MYSDPPFATNVVLPLEPFSCRPLGEMVSEDEALMFSTEMAHGTPGDAAGKLSVHEEQFMRMIFPESPLVAV
jgi:hypothetical protein